MIETRSPWESPKMLVAGSGTGIFVLLMDGEGGYWWHHNFHRSTDSLLLATPSRSVAEASRVCGDNDDADDEMIMSINRAGSDDGRIIIFSLLFVDHVRGN
eukprot:scaffold2724_cov193-Amphora_coffeaeformis.AAC.6